MERQRLRASAQQGGGGGGGSQAARDLAEEAEEAARQLERLSRESGDRQLEEIARGLQRAADAMRRSAANRGNTGVTEARSALERLRDARDRLEGVQDDRLERDLADARERVAGLSRQQEDVQNRMAAMRRAGRPSADQVGRINETKQDMAEEVGDLLAQLDQLGASARRDGASGARELEEAAETIRETQLRERILWSRSLVGRQGQEEYAEAFEDQNAQAIQSLANRLDEAADAVRDRVTDDLATEALESARDLMRSLESLERRTRNETRGGEGDAQEGQGGEQQGEGAQGNPGEREGSAQGNPGEREGSAQGAAGNPGERAGDPGERAGDPGARRGDPGARTGAPGPRDYDFDRVGPGGPRAFDPDAIRQMRREVRERAGEARTLAGLVERAGADPRELQAMIDAMRLLDRQGTYADTEEVLRLQSELVQTIKQLEFRLRREFAAGDEERIFLYQSGDVPEEYRALVEEYYRALSRDEGSRARDGANRGRGAGNDQS